MVIFSASDEPALRRQAMEATATGYVAKGSPPSEIFDALRGAVELVTSGM